MCACSCREECGEDPCPNDGDSVCDTDNSCPDDNPDDTDDSCASDPENDIDDDNFYSNDIDSDSICVDAAVVPTKLKTPPVVTANVGFKGAGKTAL